MSLESEMVDEKLIMEGRLTDKDMSLKSAMVVEGLVMEARLTD